MVVRFFFLIEPVHQITAQNDPYGGKARENYDERHADLTEQLQGKPAVIPDIQMQPFIDNNPCHEFHCCHKNHAPDELNPKRISPVQHLPLNSKKHKTNAPEYEHAPVRESAEHKLKEIIDAAACCP